MFGTAQNVDMLINKFEYINITLFIFDIILLEKHLLWNRALIEAPIAAAPNVKKGLFWHWRFAPTEPTKKQG